MYAKHRRLGAWQLMLHGNVFLQYIDEGSDRGDEQFGSINWIMGMARRSALRGELWLRAMFSAETWTVGECGYPDLLATGELCNGEPLHDRQHPHDLFMEIAAGYERTIADDLAIQVYGGPAAEPALGPTAYPHRLSSFPGPLAPITHHWLDATHISFGVVTTGLFSRRWKLEGSLFNGREPDEERTDFDFASLSSYSGRLAFMPNPNWSLQVSAAQLNEAEFPEEPGGSRVDVTRYTASAVYHRPFTDAFLAATLAYGHNEEEGTGTNAILSEASVNLHEKHIFSGRFEWVEKTGEDLAVNEPRLDQQVFRLAKAGVAYTFQLPGLWGWAPGIGAGGSVSFIPDDLELVYGERHPIGFILFASLRPERMQMLMDSAASPHMQRHE